MDTRMPGHSSGMTMPHQMGTTHQTGMNHSSGTSHQMPSMTVVSLDQVQYTATQSGNWSDPAIWGGTVPPAGAKVHIPNGLTVTVDGLIPVEHKTIRIDGTLTFATDVNTELKVDTLVTTATGHLILGTQSNPIAANVTAKLEIADDGPIDTVWDPSLVSRGLLLHGQTTIYGAEKTAFGAVSTFPRANDTSLTLKTVPTGWQVGDKLVIAGTSPTDPTSDETVTITQINGSTISFSPPLVRDHVAPRSDLDVHVANLTRNVQITSENPDVIGQRGHVMVMHTNNADINFASFDDLGRSDKTIPYSDWEMPGLDADLPLTFLGGDNVRGRYSLHFHKGGTDTGPAKVNGSVVTDGPGWGYVNHSSNVDFSNNVSHNLVGAAYYTEAGDEIGSFINNIAIRTVNPNYPLEGSPNPGPPIDGLGNPRPPGWEQLVGGGTEEQPDARFLRQDYGFQGDGFWLHGPNVRVEGNVVSGVSGHAYIAWPEGLFEEGANGRSRATTHDSANLTRGGELLPDGTQMQIFDVPIQTFDNNIGYSATRGIQLYYLHSEFFGPGTYTELGLTPPSQAYDQQLRTTLSNSTIWGVQDYGFQSPYVNRVTLDNMTFIGSGDPNSIGVDLNHFHSSLGFQVRNITVEDFGIGIQAPRKGKSVFEGATLANLTDIELLDATDARSITFRDVVFAPLSNALSGQEAGRQNYALRATFADPPEGDSTLPATEKFTEFDPIWFLQPDRLTVETTGQPSYGLYYTEQGPNFVPLPTNDPLAGFYSGLDQNYVGQTNQQLMDAFGFSFGGALLPASAVTRPEVSGGLTGPVAPTPTTFPPPTGFNDNSMVISRISAEEEPLIPPAFDPNNIIPSTSVTPPSNSPPPPPPSTNPQPPSDSGTPMPGPTNIAFLGDSITQGTEPNARFTDFLNLDPTQFSISNFGVGGAGLTNSAEVLYQSTSQYNAFLQSQPDIVWLMIGGNDLSRGSDIGTFTQNLSQVVNQIKAIPSAPKVVIANQPPVFQLAEPTLWPTYVNQWLPAIQGVATATGAQYFDLTSQISDYPANYAPDLVHPLSAGAQSIAALIAPAVQS
ncbi:MAG: GDSL-type esterase/lipase family protein, partial [Pseudomonadota bacterium]